MVKDTCKRLIIVAIVCMVGWNNYNKLPSMIFPFVAVEGFHSTCIPQFSVLSPSKSSTYVDRTNKVRQPRDVRTLHIAGLLSLRHSSSDEVVLHNSSNTIPKFDKVSRLITRIWSMYVVILFTTVTMSMATDSIGDISSVFEVPRIEACTTTSSTAGSNTNCVSTASIKQVDMFMLPWTWPESISVNEVLSRFKGIIASDQTLSLIESKTIHDTTKSNNNNNDYYYYRIQAARNVCTDEIELLLNSNEHIITFRSKQISGPDNISDFGSNRRRLEDIRHALKIVTIMGNNNDNNDESNEGISGQLRAFWGFQSGSGYESVLLDED
jgi:uncharacterized protein (DUF1499 family)